MIIPHPVKTPVSNDTTQSGVGLEGHVGEEMYGLGSERYQC